MYSSPMVRTSDVSLSSVLFVMDSPPEVVAEDDVREEAIGAMSSKSHLEQNFTALRYCTYNMNIRLRDTAAYRY